MNSGPLTRPLSPGGCEPPLPGWKGVCRQGPWGWTSFPGPSFHPGRGGTVSWQDHWSSEQRGARGNTFISYILHKCEEYLIWIQRFMHRFTVYLTIQQGHLCVRWPCRQVQIKKKAQNLQHNKQKDVWLSWTWVANVAIG